VWNWLLKKKNFDHFQILFIHCSNNKLGSTWEFKAKYTIVQASFLLTCVHEITCYWRDYILTWLNLLLSNFSIFYPLTFPKYFFPVLLDFKSLFRKMLKLELIFFKVFATLLIFLHSDTIITILYELQFILRTCFYLAVLLIVGSDS
jgi:hypothetical protein